MQMREITERHEAQEAARRTVVKTANIYVVLSKIFKPIVKIGGEKVDKKLYKISQFWATVHVGRFVVDGKKYQIKPAGEGFQIVAV